jgi:hypothetical protein
VQEHLVPGDASFESGDSGELSIILVSMY